MRYKVKVILNNILNDILNWGYIYFMNYDLQSSNFRASNVPNSTSAESGLKRFGDKRISDLLVESRQANVHRQRVQEFIIEKLLFA